MKGLTLFLSVVALLAAGISGVLYILAGDEQARLREDLQFKEKDLEILRSRARDLEQQRDALSTQLKTTELNLEDLRARNTTLEARNAQLVREIAQVREQLGSRASVDQAAARQIAELNRQLLEARATAETGNPAANEQITALQARVAELETELANLNAGGSASTGDPFAHVPEDLTGHVIDVGPRAAFVVLDIGTRNGAAPSLEMVLRRGSVVIARVRLTEVKETYSVAHILPRTGPGNVRPGDTASRS